MYQLKLVIFILFNLIVLSSCTTRTSLISDPIDDLLKNYDPKFRPDFGKYAVNVKVSTYITKLFDYSDTDDTVKINFYFRQSWVDSRLAFDNTTIPAYITDINFGADFAKKIWTPDTFLSNSHRTSYVSKDEANTFVILYRNGTVFTSKRLTGKIQCLGSKTWFPFDHKECHMHIESYSMKSKDVSYQWIDNHKLEVHRNLIPFHVNPATKYSQHIALLTGVYSIIGYKFTIERYYFNYILSLYLPIILTTLLAGSALNASKRDYSSTSNMVSSFLFVGQLICSIMIKLHFSDKLTGSFTALDLFLLINIAFMFCYQFIQMNSDALQKTSLTSRPLHSDTKIILDDTFADKNQQFGCFKFGLTLGYSLLVASYLFVCVTLRYLMTP